MEIELRSVKVEKSEVSRDLEDESNSAMHLKVEVEEEEVLLKADLDPMVGPPFTSLQLIAHGKL